MDAVPKRAMQGQRAMQGRLEVFGDKGAPRPLSTGDRVKAQYQGNPRNAWFAGTAVAANADGTWRIQYDDMEEEDLHVHRPGSCMPSIMHLDGPLDCQRLHQACSLQNASYTALMVADALTKSLPFPAHAKHRDLMMGHPLWGISLVLLFYCYSSYYKAVRVGGVEDMCNEIRRAEACVD